jgi:hypothetical protein
VRARHRRHPDDGGPADRPAAVGIQGLHRDSPLQTAAAVDGDRETGDRPPLLVVRESRRRDGGTGEESRRDGDKATHDSHAGFDARPGPAGASAS